MTGARRSDPIPRKYLGEPAVLMASGPSLSKEQIEYIRPLHAAGKIRVFGLNDTYKICDFMDVFYACDPKWWELNPKAVENPCKEKWTQSRPKAEELGINWVYGSSGQGICLIKNKIHFGSNSGFQLINLAWHYGIRQFFLIGYNMDVPRGTQQHFFGVHPKGLNQGNNYRGFAAQYDKIQGDIKNLIINCTEPTMLKCFRQMPLEKALETERRDRTAHALEEAPDPPAVPEAPRPARVGRRHRNPGRDRAVIDPASTELTYRPSYGGPPGSRILNK